VFLGRDFGHVKNYSEATAVAIDEEIRRIVEENYRGLAKSWSRTRSPGQGLRGPARAGKSRRQRNPRDGFRPCRRGSGCVVSLLPAAGPCGQQE